MKYLLSEKEYKELTCLTNKKTKEEQGKLQEFCTMVAEKLPITFGTYPYQTHVPWGCLLSNDDDLYSVVCDECPCVDICPYENKEWST